MSTDIWGAEGLPAREQVKSWVSVKGTVGDKVFGEFMGWWISPASAVGFNEQIGIALKITDVNQTFKSNKGELVEVAIGDVIGVSLGSSDYLKSRIEPSVVGDMMGIKYEADKDTGKPQKAKIVKVYNQALEERRKAGTMKVTTAEVSTEKPVDDDPTKLDF